MPNWSGCRAAPVIPGHPVELPQARRPRLWPSESRSKDRSLRQLYRSKKRKPIGLDELCGGLQQSLTVRCANAGYPNCSRRACRSQGWFQRRHLDRLPNADGTSRRDGGNVARNSMRLPTPAVASILAVFGGMPTGISPGRGVPRRAAGPARIGARKASSAPSTCGPDGALGVDDRHRCHRRRRHQAWGWTACAVRLGAGKAGSSIGWRIVIASSAW